MTTCGRSTELKFVPFEIDPLNIANHVLIAEGESKHISLVGKA